MDKVAPKVPKRRKRRKHWIRGIVTLFRVLAIVIAVGALQVSTTNPITLGISAFFFMIVIANVVAAVRDRRRRIEQAGASVDALVSRLHEGLTDADSAHGWTETSAFLLLEHLEQVQIDLRGRPIDRTQLASRPFLRGFESCEVSSLRASTGVILWRVRASCN